MESAIKKVEKIRQIVKLKQVMKRWKVMSLGGRSVLSPPTTSDSESDSSLHRRKIPAGFFAVYVGPERRRFVIPTRFLNLPIFAALLKKTEEEFGFPSCGGLILPCEVGFFEKMLTILEKDEQRFRSMGLDEALRLLSDVGFDSCREGSSSCHVFTPLLQKARV